MNTRDQYQRVFGRRELDLMLKHLSEEVRSRYVEEDEDGNVIAIVIPAGADAIANNTFSSLQTLRYVTIPDSVQAIGRSAFERCTALECVDIPSSVREIGASAFYDCQHLRRVKLHEGTKRICSFAFGNCPKLWQVRVPQSAKRGLSKSAFAGSTCDIKLLLRPVSKIKAFLSDTGYYDGYRHFSNGVDIDEHYY